MVEIIDVYEVDLGPEPSRPIGLFTFWISLASRRNIAKLLELYFLYLTASLYIKWTVPTASVSALRDSHCAGSKHVEHAIRRPRPRADASQLVAGRRTYPKTVSRLHSASACHDIRTTILLITAAMV